MPGHTIKLRGAVAVLLLATLAGVSACGSGSDDAAVAQAAAAARAKDVRAAYDRQILAWRADRLQHLMLPDGWLSLVGMHWLEVGNTRIGHGVDNGTRLAVGPDHLGVLKLGADGSLLFTADPGADATVNGAPATAPTRLVSDADSVAEPSVVGFNKGDASFIVIKLGERHALRVRDALALTRMAFPGIPSFDIDPAFRFNATFQPHPAGQKLEIINVLGIVEPMDNPGTVTFSKDGKSHVLEALDEGDHRLFLIYADLTSGHQSYSAARYLYSSYPDASGHTIVDFNEGYNPPCAFTDFATCPLPPLSNRLDLAISAGEMKPAKLGPTSP